MTSHPVFISRRRPGSAGALIIAVGYFIFALLALDDFGVTWDEEVHFAAGDTYLNRILKEGLGATFSKSDFTGSMENYGPVFDVWGAVNCRLLHGKFGWLAADNARHLHLVIITALTVFFTYLLVQEAQSARAAVFSSLFLVAFPRFLGHSFNNPKDIPVTFMFVVSFYFLFLRVKTGKKRYSLGLTAAMGVGLATRITYVIVPVAILLYTIVYYLRQAAVRKLPLSRFFSNCDILLAMVIGLPLGVVFWPYLWSHPLSRILEIFRFFYFHVEQTKLSIIYWGSYYVPGCDLPWHYAPVHLLVTTPLITLGLGVLGLLVVLLSIARGRAVSRYCRASGSFGSLLILWMVLGLFPFMLPGQRVYDGIRHFLFIVPPLCMVAGLGLDCLVALGSKWVGKKMTFLTVILLYLLLFISVFSYHPLYTVYYNALVGGPRGAFNRFSLEYWGNAYKPACRWLNKNAPPGSSVLVLMAPHIAQYYLRDDIVVLPPLYGRLPVSRYDFSLYIIRDDDPLLDKEAKAVYTMTVKGQPILKIHRWPQ